MHGCQCETRTKEKNVLFELFQYTYVQFRLTCVSIFLCMLANLWTHELLLYLYKIWWNKLFSLNRKSILFCMLSVCQCHYISLWVIAYASDARQPSMRNEIAWVCTKVWSFENIEQQFFFLLWLWGVCAYANTPLCHQTQSGKEGWWGEGECRERECAWGSYRNGCRTRKAVGKLQSTVMNGSRRSVFGVY